MSQLKQKTVKLASIVAITICLALTLALAPSFCVGAEANLEPIITVTESVKVPTKALTNTTVTLPTATATKADKVTSLPVSVRVSLNNTDITVEGKKEYNLDKKGIYNIYFEAKDTDANFYAFKSFDIDVRDVWLEIKLNNENKKTADVGMPFALEKASAVNFNNEVLTNVIVKTEVKFGDLKVEVNNGAFIPSSAGEYSVIYTAETGGEKATVTNEITASGTTPTINVQNIPGAIFLKKEFRLPEAEAFDANGAVVTVDVKVSFNGEEVAVKDYKFTPTKLGDYTIVYTVTNAKGIKASVTRVVACVKAKISSTTILIICLSVAGAVVVVGGGVLACFLIIKKKKNKNNTKNVENIENENIENENMENEKVEKEETDKPDEK